MVITTEAYTNAVVRLLAECTKTTEATKALNQLKGNGRLAAWLQGQLNSILSSRLKGLSVIDDFRFLLSVGGSLSGPVFDAIARVSDETVKIPHTAERSLNGGLGLDFQKTQRLLHTVFSEDLKKLPPHFLKTTPKEVKVKQEVTTISKIADAYPAPPSQVTPVNLVVQYIPTVSRVGISRKPEIIEVKVPVEVKVPYEVKVPVEVKVPYEVKVPVHIPPPPPFKPQTDFKQTQTEQVSPPEPAPPRGMDSRNSSDNAVFLNRPRDSNTSITSGKDYQQGQSPKNKSPRKSGEFGIVKPEADQVLAANFSSFGENASRSAVNTSPPAPPRERPYPEKTVQNKPPLPPALNLSTTFNPVPSPPKHSPKKGVEPLSISPLPTSNEVGFQENSKAFGGVSGATFADSRTSGSFNTGSEVAAGSKSQNEANASTQPGSNVSGPKEETSVVKPPPPPPLPESAAVAPPADIKRQPSQAKSNRSSTSMVEPVVVTIEETKNVKLSSSKVSERSQDKQVAAGAPKPPSKTGSQLQEKKDDSFYGFSDDEQGKSAGNKTPKSARSVIEASAANTKKPAAEKEASFYSDDEAKAPAPEAAKDDKSLLSKKSRAGDASFDFYDDDSKSKAKPAEDADQSFDFDDGDKDNKSPDKSFDDFYQEEPVKEVPAPPKVEEKKPEPKPEPKYAKVADPAVKKDIPLTKIQTALKLGRSVDDLPDQGRKYKPAKFEIPSEDVARKYLTEFNVTKIDIPERKWPIDLDAVAKFDISANGIAFLGTVGGALYLGKLQDNKFVQLAKNDKEGRVWTLLRIYADETEDTEEWFTGQG